MTCDVIMQPPCACKACRRPTTSQRDDNSSPSESAGTTPSSSLANANCYKCQHPDFRIPLLCTGAWCSPSWMSATCLSQKQMGVTSPNIKNQTQRNHLIFVAPVSPLSKHFFVKNWPLLQVAGDLLLSTGHHSDHFGPSVLTAKLPGLRKQHCCSCAKNPKPSQSVGDFIPNKYIQ